MSLPLVFSALSLALCLVLFFYLRWYVRRRTGAEELLAEYRTEVRRLIAEIDAATDRDSQLVEERIKNLKSLLDDTDRRIAVYVRELERGRAGEALYSSLGRGIRAALDTRKPVREPAPMPEIPPPEETESGGLRRQIAVMAAQGLTPAEIASRLDLSLSEVDLALKLRGRR